MRSLYSGGNEEKKKRNNGGENKCILGTTVCPASRRALLGFYFALSRQKYCLREQITIVLCTRPSCEQDVPDGWLPHRIRAMFKASESAENQPIGPHGAPQETIR